MNDETNDIVNHPDHYIFDNGIETFDYICAVTKDLQGEEAVCVANIIKYISRFNKKNGSQDLDKAAWYLDKLRKRVKNTEAQHSDNFTVLDSIDSF